MPIRIQADLPAIEVLESENIFVMTHERANLQDIRPLKIAILNLMPTKIETETQLLRLLGNTPLQVDVELLHPATHISKNTSSYHLNTFYKTFADVKDQKFDGLIITGAPVEKLPFEEVDYWDEMCQIMEWSKENVYSVLHICWGAQAGLYYHYGIRKELLLPLLCGIFLVESLSVMLQVSYFKYTKRKYGEGRRILLMSPLHHHYQKQGFFETKIVTRFWIVSLLLAAITLVTLKIR